MVQTIANPNSKRTKGVIGMSEHKSALSIIIVALTMFGLFILIGEGFINDTVESVGETVTSVTKNDDVAEKPVVVAEKTPEPSQATIHDDESAKSLLSLFGTMIAALVILVILAGIARIIVYMVCERDTNTYLEDPSDRYHIISGIRTKIIKRISKKNEGRKSALILCDIADEMELIAKINHSEKGKKKESYKLAKRIERESDAILRLYKADPKRFWLTMYKYEDTYAKVHAAIQRARQVDSYTDAAFLTVIASLITHPYHEMEKQQQEWLDGDLNEEKSVLDDLKEQSDAKSEEQKANDIWDQFKEIPYLDEFEDDFEESYIEDVLKGHTGMTDREFYKYRDEQLAKAERSLFGPGGPPKIASHHSDHWMKESGQYPETDRHFSGFDRSGDSSSHDSGYSSSSGCDSSSSSSDSGGSSCD